MYITISVKMYSCRPVAVRANLKTGLGNESTVVIIKGLTKHKLDVQNLRSQPPDLLPIPFKSSNQQCSKQEGDITRNFINNTKRK